MWSYNHLLAHPVSLLLPHPLQLDKEERRFLLLAALLLPLRALQHVPPRGKPAPATAVVIRDSLKWRVKVRVRAGGSSSEYGALPQRRGTLSSRTKATLGTVTHTTHRICLVMVVLSWGALHCATCVAFHHAAAHCVHGSRARRTST